MDDTLSSNETDVTNLFKFGQICMAADKRCIFACPLLETIKESQIQLFVSIYSGRRDNQQSVSKAVIYFCKAAVRPWFSLV